jgi:hypothetical protein
MGNVLIAKLTLGKQEWIVILDGVKNGPERCDSCESFFLTHPSRVKSQSMVFFIVAFRQPSLDDCCLFFPDSRLALGWVAM